MVTGIAVKPITMVWYGIEARAGQLAPNENLDPNSIRDAGADVFCAKSAHNYRVKIRSENL